MIDYRQSYRKTAFLALAAAVLFLLLSIATRYVSGPKAALLLLLILLPCLGLASVAALVALGGAIALHRDALEREGRPYFTPQPRERAPGIVAFLRRRLLTLFSRSRSKLRLWPGEWVQIRPYAEIAQTLDKEGRLEALPFMPEMVPYCGGFFRVYRRMDMVHDYFTPGQSGLRRLRDCVTLGDLRCTGASHGGCQAGCQYIWKEAWLKPVNGHASYTASLPETALTLENFAKVTSLEGDERYACQMTEIPKASKSMWWHDPRIYLRDLVSGNVRLVPSVKAIAIALFNLVQNKTNNPTAPYKEPSVSKADKSPPLELRAGDIVRVKPKHEIEKTLKNSKNLGLWFDVEMHRYCGGTFRVAGRVQTIIAEENGRLLTLKNPCIVLDGVCATGEYIALCPQSDLIYWREIWLNRLSTAQQTIPSHPAHEIVA